MSYNVASEGFAEARGEGGVVDCKHLEAAG